MFERRLKTNSMIFKYWNALRHPCVSVLELVGWHCSEWHAYVIIYQTICGAEACSKTWICAISRFWYSIKLLSFKLNISIEKSTWWPHHEVCSAPELDEICICSPAWKPAVSVMTHRQVSGTHEWWTLLGSCLLTPTMHYFKYIGVTYMVCDATNHLVE